MVYVCVFHCIQILEIATSWVKLICEEEELMYRGKALLSCIREGIVVALLLVPSVSWTEALPSRSRAKAIITTKELCEEPPGILHEISHSKLKWEILPGKASPPNTLHNSPEVVMYNFWIKGTDKSLIVQSTIVFFYFLIFVQNFRWWRAQSSCTQRPCNIDLTRSPLPKFLFQIFWLHNRQGLCCVGFGWSLFAYLDLIENLFNANFVSYTTGKGSGVLGLVDAGIHIWMWLNRISWVPILLATQEERVELCWVWLRLACTFGCDWIEFL
jgi:hypothetical protein